MTRPRSLGKPAGRLVTVGLCAVLLAGCTGKESSPPTATPTSTATVAADGTTVAGTVLSLGDRAGVRWRADRSHTSVVDVTVTKVDRGRIKDLRQFPLPAAARSSSVYYVSVVIRNTGDGDLGGEQLALFGKVSDDLVVQTVRLNSPFDRCNNPPLPRRFTSGASAHVCLVMLAPDHGRISQIQWRQGQTEPISWRVR